jgi:hypothetical protein
MNVCESEGLSRTVPTGGAVRIGFTRSGVLFINTGNSEVKLQGRDIDFLKEILNG